MKSKSHSAGDPAQQFPTPRSTLSPVPTSKPTSKRFKSLAAHPKPRDDPFRQAQAESSPLIAIPDDDDDIFGTPCGKKRLSQRRLWDSRNRTEEQRNDDELASLLDNWQAFLTPEKSKREVGLIEPRTIRPDLKAEIKESPLANRKWHAKHRSQSSASMPGKTSHEPNSLQQSVTETSSPKKRPRRATAELTLKRLRLPDEEGIEDDCEGLPPPNAKRVKLFTPMKTDREEPHESNSRPGTPTSSTNDSPFPVTQRRTSGLVPLSKKKDLQTPRASISGLGTPDASATESPSPVISTRGVKIISSPNGIDHQRPDSGDPRPSTPASLKSPPSPATTPRSALQEETPSANLVRRKRKRGAQEAGLSSSREESKRVKVAKPLANMGKPAARAS
ncbi:hypothetical protein P171DRAFT_291924 [Karstenula rhodostoma CBS 690.94]|uniref:Uncharacterized protein n=1 Tax=Karstenula rhodostoma CBS 690.94 TaxID=1392251 RepID=A0A9P4UDC5_9PLEO|nr:hypothetical protein P171DRAFT_291924 [Karstenula rhodostoma CBS 690.94]